MSFIRNLTRNRHASEPSRASWLVVGLGNPGGQYARTRHNIGFMCTNRLVRRVGARFRSSSRDRADLAEATVHGVALAIAQPQTFMNDSGVAVARLSRRLNLPNDRILVVYDEVDLPFGSIRIRAEGSSGGHRGMQSIIDYLGSAQVPRIRVGIGRSGLATRDHVLSEFASTEGETLSTICDQVVDMIEVIVTENVTVAMNRFNASPTRSDPTSKP